MAKTIVCPKCEYPNPDNLENCFKCGVNLAEAVAEDKAAKEKIAYEQRKEAELLKQQRKQDLSNYNKASIDKDIDCDVTEMRIYIYKLATRVNIIGWCVRILIVIFILGILISSNSDSYLAFQIVVPIACIGIIVGLAFDVVVSMLYSKQRSLGLQDKILKAFEKTDKEDK